MPNSAWASAFSASPDFASAFASTVVTQVQVGTVRSAGDILGVNAADVSASPNGTNVVNQAQRVDAGSGHGEDVGDVTLVSQAEMPEQDGGTNILTQSQFAIVGVGTDNDYDDITLRDNNDVLSASADDGPTFKIDIDFSVDLSNGVDIVMSTQGIIAGFGIDNGPTAEQENFDAA